MIASTLTPSGGRNRPQRSKHDLSRPRARLLELMQEINFGRLERLTVHQSEPVFDPAPEVVREIKFGGDNGPRPELGTGDFLLKSQVVELFEHLDRVGTCHVEVLEIKHGLPFRMLVREDAV